MKTMPRIAAPFLLAAALVGCSDAPPLTVGTAHDLKVLHTHEVGRYALIALPVKGDGPHDANRVGAQQVLVIKTSEFKNDNALKENATPAQLNCSTFNIITTTLRDDGRLTAKYGNFDRNIAVALNLSEQTALILEDITQGEHAAPYHLRDFRKETYCTHAPKAP